MKTCAEAAEALGEGKGRGREEKRRCMGEEKMYKRRCGAHNFIIK